MRAKQIAIWTLIVLSFVVFASAALADGAKSIAIALKTDGEVESKTPDSKWVNLTRGTILNDGDMVRTGKDGFAALVFTDDKSQIKLRPGTEITLNADRQADQSLAKRINLELGELFADVKEQKGSLRVSTPTAVASVKGTKFWVTVTPDGQTEQITVEGIVELKSNLTGETVDVTAGYIGTVDTDGNLTTEEYVPDDVPDYPEDKETGLIKLDFIDENGNQKSLIIEYEK